MELKTFTTKAATPRLNFNCLLGLYDIPLTTKFSIPAAHTFACVFLSNYTKPGDFFFSLLSFFFLLLSFLFFQATPTKYTI